MFERPERGESVILVHIDFTAADPQEDLDEFLELVSSAGANPVSLITGSRRKPASKYFVGTGKANEILDAVRAHHSTLVIFNHRLTPAQERNLERLLQARVLNRTALILDIFAQRARSFEGKCQVELAQLEHMATRLVRGWTHLERQKGGIGLRGPGETQLETDRRLLRGRIKTLNKKLMKLRNQRAQNRSARHRALLATVSLVGYTNAGKSTVFNKLCASNVYVADQLFATLDPILRSVEIPNFGKIILADTVGFIRHLPHQLVEAFRATLDETRDAELLLHVIDAHDKHHHEKITQVNTVLTQIDAEQVPCLEVFNKIDLLDDVTPRIDRNAEGAPVRVWISASTGAGFDLLLDAIRQLLSKDIVTCEVTLAPAQGRVRSELYKLQAIENEATDEAGNWVLQIKLPRAEYNRLFS